MTKPVTYAPRTHRRNDIQTSSESDSEDTNRTKPISRGAARQPSRTSVTQSVAWLPLVAMAAWDINDASGPQGVPNATLLLGFATACLLLAVVLRRDRGIDIPMAPIVLLAGAATTGLAMVPFRADQNAAAIASDLGTYGFFALCLVVASLFRDELLSERTVRWFIATYIAIAMFAWFAATRDLRPAYWYAGRWDPPYFMLLGALALYARHAKQLAARAACVGILGGLFYLGLASGNRTQFILGALFVVLAWASSRRASFIMITGAVGYAFLHQLGLIHFNPFEGLFADSRFSLVEGGLDDSLVGRLEEMNDAWFHVTHLNTAAQSVFGRGVGAGWEPITRQRLAPTPDGYMYYIHIGFVSLGFKHGLLGIAMFAYWLWMALKSIRRMFDPRVSLGARFWYLGGIGFSINYFLQNSLFDPPAVIAMSMLLILEHNRRAESVAVSTQSNVARASGSATQRN